MSAAFATPVDLQQGWRTLTAAEAARADVLLAKASRAVRAEFPSVDAKIDAGRLDQDLVADVVCDMVRRVLVTPVDQNATGMQQTTGPFSTSMTFTNPSGDIYLTKTDRRKLGLLRQAASTISGLRDG